MTENTTVWSEEL